MKIKDINKIYGKLKMKCFEMPNASYTNVGNNKKIKHKLEMNYFSQESKRLKFRKLTTKDISSWIEFFDENDRLHFLGMDLSKDKKELASDWINTQLTRYEEYGFGHLAVNQVFDGNTIVGKNHYEYSVENLPTGTYYVFLKGVGRLVTKPFIKQ